jgi:hypothetical protein
LPAPGIGRVLEVLGVDDLEGEAVTADLASEDMDAGDAHRRLRLREAAEAIVRSSDDAGLQVRLLGGIAVALRCPSARDTGRLVREYSDIDLVTTRKHARKLTPVMQAVGFEPNERFNAANGATRLSYFAPDEEHIDVFVDDFRLCHVLPLAGRLNEHPVTISLEDLLLTKLQVARLNEKDVTDALALLIDHGVGDGGIDESYILALLSRDWGWWRTSTETITAITGVVDQIDLSDADAALARAALSTLSASIDAAPKSVKWRARARVGDRRPWRVDPEDVGE